MFTSSQQFDGSEANGDVSDFHELPSTITAQYIRFKPVSNFTCLRVEVYGTPGNSLFVDFRVGTVGGAVVSWLGARLRIERSGFEPWSGEIVLCSWARHFAPNEYMKDQILELRREI